MNKKATLIGGAFAAVLLLPGFASATVLLDTGTPTGTGGPAVLNSSSWVAAEFAATAGDDITSVAAYLTQGVGQPGDQFTFDIYSNTGFTGRSTGRILETSVTGTYTADGWNTATLDWTPTTSGDYWLALQVSSTGQTNGLDLPQETSATTGTVEALGFARLGSGTNSSYTLSGALPVGLEVTASPVPLPPTVWLLGTGLLCFGMMRRRA